MAMTMYNPAHPGEILGGVQVTVAARLPRVGDFAEVAVDEHGCIVVDADQMTNLPGVFAGGSLVRGPAPVSEVVRDSRRAAAAIDRYLAARREPCT